MPGEEGSAAGPEVIELLRPWLAALALVVCALISLTIYAWRVDFRAPDVVSGLGEAAANVRLRGIAMSLQREAAELRRTEVRRMREQNAPVERRTAARHALADQLRDVALLADAAGDLDLAREWMAEAVQAAPERADLHCALVDLRTRDALPEERRMALLRLVLDHDTACAHLLAADSFLETGDSEAARAYLERATQTAPQWAEAHLAMARLQSRVNDRDAAREHAREALALADSPDTELAAAAILRSAGGSAPPRWRIIARWAWSSYAYVLPSVGVFVVLLVSPTLVRLAKRGVSALRSQRNTAESAS